MVIRDKTLDEERALYGLRDAQVVSCRFEGAADGESALKECGNIWVDNCYFALRYPLWHVTGGGARECTLAESCRAPLWYDRGLTLETCRIHGVKAVRECDDMALVNCDILSPEFGWYCRGLTLRRCRMESEYPFLACRGMEVSALDMKAKYSFQYAENVKIERSTLLTKDAFWHARNVTVRDSVVRGEYLGWYSENLRFINCTLSGTQPLCYARGLVLDNCTMEGADFAFENSDVRANIKGSVLSVKNPLSGRIEADEFGEIILDEHLPKDARCQIVLRNK